MSYPQDTVNSDNNRDNDISSEKINNDILNTTNNQNQDVIIKINQQPLNLNPNNIYKSYNNNQTLILENSQIYIPKDNIRNNYYPYSDNNRIINELKNTETSEGINNKEINDIENQDNNYTPQLKNNGNKLTIKEIKTDNNDENNNYVDSDNKEDKKCREKVCKVLKMILIILVYIIFAAFLF